MERQRYMLDLVLGICEKDYDFDDFENCRVFFKDLINVLKQMNYSEFQSEAFLGYQDTVNQMIA